MRQIWQQRFRKYESCFAQTKGAERWAKSPRQWSPMRQSIIVGFMGQTGGNSHAGFNEGKKLWVWSWALARNDSNNHFVYQPKNSPDPNRGRWPYQRGRWKFLPFATGSQSSWIGHMQNLQKLREYIGLVGIAAVLCTSHRGECHSPNGWKHGLLWDKDEIAWRIQVPNRDKRHPWRSLFVILQQHRKNWSFDLPTTTKENASWHRLLTPKWDHFSWRSSIRDNPRSIVFCILAEQ